MIAQPAPLARALLPAVLALTLLSIAAPGRAQTADFAPLPSATLGGLTSGGALGPLAAADFDADGNDDLIFGAPGADGGALYGLSGPLEPGDLTVPLPPLQRGSPDAGLATTLASGDINGDGIPDALIVSAANRRRIDVRFGGPGFFEPREAPLPDQPHILLFHSEPVRSLSVADVDGDGHDDLITGSPDQDPADASYDSGFNGLVVRFGPFAPKRGAPGLLEAARRIELTIAGASRVGQAVHAADVTGDGTPDLLLAARDADDDPVLLAIAGPVPRHSQTVELTADGGVHFTITDLDLASAIAVGDVDLDGVPDLLLAFAGDSRISVVSGFAIPPGGPTPLRRVDHELLHGPGRSGFGAHLAIADLDADGVPDLAVGAPQQGPAGRGAALLFFGADRQPLITAIRPVKAPSGATLIVHGHALLTGEVFFRTTDDDLIAGEIVSARPGQLSVLMPHRAVRDPVPLDLVVRTAAGETVRSQAVTLLPAHETVALAPGWNLQGWPGDASLSEVAVTRSGRISRIFAWDTNAGTFVGYAPGLPTGPAGPPVVRAGQGVWLHVDGAAGARWQRPSFAGPRLQDLIAGWNLVMWSGPDGTPVPEAVRAIAEVLRILYRWDPSADRFHAYAPGLPASGNDAGTLTNGEGLWLLIDRPIAWPQPAAGTPPTALSVQEAGASAVFLRQDGREASGFVVGETQIVTAAHIVQNARTVRVHFPDGQERLGVVTAVDGPMDIAVVEVSGIPPNLTRLDWESASSLAPTTAVWSWGFPLGDVFGADTNASVSGGLVSAHQSNSRGFAVLQTDAAVTNGSSGAPLVTADGRLVGVVISFITSGGDDVEGLNLAIDVASNRDRFRALLER